MIAKTRFRSWVANIRTHWRRVAGAAAGQAIYQGFNFVVDFMICPGLIFWFGWIWGALAYMLLTLAIDLVSVVLYNKVQKDIMGLELAKELRGWFGRKIMKSKKKISELSLFSKIIFVLVLSIRLNPFQIVVFMRQANEYHPKMNTEDKFIFWTSYVGGNLYWVILMGGLVEVGKKIT